MCAYINFARKKTHRICVKNDETIFDAANCETDCIKVRNVTVLGDVWGNAVSHSCAVVHCARGMAGGLHGQRSVGGAGEEIRQRRRKICEI